MGKRFVVELDRSSGCSTDLDCRSGGKVGSGDREVQVGYSPREIFWDALHRYPTSSQNESNIVITNTLWKTRTKTTLQLVMAIYNIIPYSFVDFKGSSWTNQNMCSMP